MSYEVMTNEEFASMGQMKMCINTAQEALTDVQEFFKEPYSALVVPVFIHSDLKQQDEKKTALIAEIHRHSRVVDLD